MVGNKQITNLLYYPRLNVPSNNWMKVALLYYDKIATIIPEEIYAREIDCTFRDSFLLNDLTVQLLKNKLIEKVNLEDPYDTNILAKKILDLKTNISKEDIYELKNSHQFRIYATKFSYKIFNELESLGLAKRVNGNNSNFYEPESFMVPEKLGIAMMFQLAKYIANLDDFEISTDVEEFSFELIGKENEYIEKSNYKNLFIGCHFNIPEEITFDGILEFKELYFNELKDFRLKIEHFEKEIIKVESHFLNEFIMDKIDFYQNQEKIILELLKSKGYRKITNTKIITTIRDMASNWKLGVIKGVFKFLKSYEIPLQKSENNYPSLFKYLNCD